MKCKHDWVELARGKLHRNGLSTVMWCSKCGTAKDWVAGRDDQGIWRWYRPKSYRPTKAKFIPPRYDDVFFEGLEQLERL